MLTAGEMTETAIRLCLHLQVELIPEDYHRTGEYRHVMTRVVDEYTNYQALRAALPDCCGCGGAPWVGMFQLPPRARHPTD